MPRVYGVLGLVGLLACGGEDRREDEQKREDICGAAPQHLPNQTSAHVPVGQSVPYTDLPPVGGTHSQCWGNWGVYEEELADETWVHNLEHGGVVLLYNCPDGCEAEVARLAAFADTHNRVIVTPYAALPTRFGATAWEWRLLTDCFDMPAIERFYDARYNMGREDVMAGKPPQCP